MKKLTCPEQSNLHVLLDVDIQLDGNELNALKKHISVCQSCAETLADFKANDSLLKEKLELLLKDFSVKSSVMLAINEVKPLNLTQPNQKRSWFCYLFKPSFVFFISLLILFSVYISYVNQIPTKTFYTCSVTATSTSATLDGMPIDKQFELSTLKPLALNGEFILSYSPYKDSAQQTQLFLSTKALLYLDESGVINIKTDNNPLFLKHLNGTPLNLIIDGKIHHITEESELTLQSEAESIILPSPKPEDPSLLDLTNKENESTLPTEDLDKHESSTITESVYQHEEQAHESEPQQQKDRNQMQSPFDEEPIILGGNE